MPSTLRASRILLVVGLLLADRVAHALPSGFARARVTGSLSRPTAMAFAPDGRLFVTERGTGGGGTGQVRIVKDGVLLPGAFVSIKTDDTNVSANERGVLGIAIDPGFTANHFVYVYYTVPGSPPHNRVSRFTASGDRAVAGSERALLELEPLGPGNHNGGGLQFGADGKLYVAVGENHQPANATNLDNHLGKILRINADGSVPADNPFFTAGAVTARDRIWAYGLRNPFHFAVQPGSGRIFVNDVGESTWEEIDDLARGKDYGWRGGATDGDGTAWYRYDHAAGKCISGGTFYAPPAAPGAFAGRVGHYFFGDYVAGFVREVNPATKAVSTFDTGLNGPIDFAVGADGSLYVLTYNGGELWKVTAGATVAQGLVVSTTNLDLKEGERATFTVKLAKAPAADVAMTVAKAGAASLGVTPPSFTFTPAGWATARTVTVAAAEDADLLTSSALFTISAPGLKAKKVSANAVDNDSGLGALIALPHEGDVVSGKAQEFFGGSDRDGRTQKGEFFIDGALAYTDVGPGHYHFGGSHASWDTTLLAAGAHTLKLVVTDAAGKSGSHQVRISVSNKSTAMTIVEPTEGDEGDGRPEEVAGGEGCGGPGGGAAAGAVLLWGTSLRLRRRRR